MSEEQILVELTTIVEDVLDRPNLKLDRQMSAQDVEGWDSSSNINIIVGVEMKFGVRFRTAELDEISNIGDFTDLIAKKLFANKK
jgi:acyl carrier protein